MGGSSYRGFELTGVNCMLIFILSSEALRIKTKEMYLTLLSLKIISCFILLEAHSVVDGDA